MFDFMFGSEPIVQVVAWYTAARLEQLIGPLADEFVHTVDPTGTSVSAKANADKRRPA